MDAIFDLLATAERSIAIASSREEPIPSITEHSAEDNNNNSNNTKSVCPNSGQPLSLQWAPEGLSHADQRRAINHQLHTQQQHQHHHQQQQQHQQEALALLREASSSLLRLASQWDAYEKAHVAITMGARGGSSRGVSPSVGAVALPCGEAPHLLRAFGALTARTARSDALRRRLATAYARWVALWAMRQRERHVEQQHAVAGAVGIVRARCERLNAERSVQRYNLVHVLAEGHGRRLLSLFWRRWYAACVARRARTAAQADLSVAAQMAARADRFRLIRSAFAIWRAAYAAARLSCRDAALARAEQKLIDASSEAEANRRAFAEAAAAADRSVQSLRHQLDEAEALNARTAAAAAAAVAERDAYAEALVVSDEGRCRALIDAAEADSREAIHRWQQSDEASAMRSADALRNASAAMAAQTASLRSAAVDSARDASRQLASLHHKVLLLGCELTEADERAAVAAEAAMRYTAVIAAAAAAERSLHRRNALAVAEAADRRVADANDAADAAWKACDEELGAALARAAAADALAEQCRKEQSEAMRSARDSATSLEELKKTVDADRARMAHFYDTASASMLRHCGALAELFANGIATRSDLLAAASAAATACHITSSLSFLSSLGATADAALREAAVAAASARSEGEAASRRLSFIQWRRFADAGRHGRALEAAREEAVAARREGVVQRSSLLAGADAEVRRMADELSEAISENERLRRGLAARPQPAADARLFSADFARQQQQQRRDSLLGALAADEAAARSALLTDAFVGAAAAFRSWGAGAWAAAAVADRRASGAIALQRTTDSAAAALSGRLMRQRQLGSAFALWRQWAGSRSTSRRILVSAEDSKRNAEARSAALRLFSKRATPLLRGLRSDLSSLKADLTESAANTGSSLVVLSRRTEEATRTFASTITSAAWERSAEAQAAAWRDRALLGAWYHFWALCSQRRARFRAEERVNGLSDHCRELEAVIARALEERRAGAAPTAALSPHTSVGASTDDWAPPLTAARARSLAALRDGRRAASPSPSSPASSAPAAVPAAVCDTVLSFSHDVNRQIASSQKAVAAADEVTRRVGALSGAGVEGRGALGGGDSLGAAEEGSPLEDDVRRIAAQVRALMQDMPPDVAGGVRHDF